MKWAIGTFLFGFAILLISYAIQQEELAMRQARAAEPTFADRIALNPGMAEAFARSQKGDRLLADTASDLNGGVLTEDHHSVRMQLFLAEFGRRRLAELCVEHSPFVTDQDCNEGK